MQILYYWLNIKRGNLTKADLQQYKKGDKAARTYRKEKEYSDMSCQF